MNDGVRCSSDLSYPSTACSRCELNSGSQPEVLTTFDRSAFRDIHAHHMQVHRAEYAEFMLDDSQDLVALRRQITHPEDE